MKTYDLSPYLVKLNFVFRMHLKTSKKNGTA
jgi:hypothetical protein